MTWHRIPVARDEGEEISLLLGAALERNRRATMAGIEALREMGFGRQLQMQTTPIEVLLVYGVQANFLYLNDGALSLYRTLGGTKTVDDVSESLPDAQFLSKSIRDVWRNERP